jgi:divalent metal cation (Fe/Co/Zn/Cd) transporter
MNVETTDHGSARHALRLEYATAALAAAEAAGALLSGLLAGSIALVAFGADSVIEMLSAVVVLSQLRVLVRGRDHGFLDQHRSHRILAVLFYALALYVTVSALWALTGARHPHENAWGIAVSAASSVAMPLLAHLKRRGARRLDESGHAALSRLVAADAAETALCAMLAWSTLVGVSLAWRHWWWADPVASLAVVFFAVREGREAWECATD